MQVSSKACALEEQAAAAQKKESKLLQQVADGLQRSRVELQEKQRLHQLAAAARAKELECLGAIESSEVDEEAARITLEIEGQADEAQQQPSCAWHGR